MGINIKKIKCYRLILMFVFVVLLSSCFHVEDEEKLYILASALTKLSAAVESTVRYKRPPKDISDKELLVLATKHDPTLLSPFSGYAMLVKSENRHAIVLMCTTDKQKALLEDAGCSAKMDVHRWKGEKENDCIFTVNLESACLAK